MAAGTAFSGIKVSSNLISNGHHRYLASLLAGCSILQIPAGSVSEIVIYDGASVTFEELDWDTPAKIKMLNEQDAAFNQIPIEVITELTA